MPVQTQLAPRIIRPTVQIAALLVSTLMWGHFGALRAQTLRGSHASLDRQNQEARRHGFAYLKNTKDVLATVDRGELVPLEPNHDLHLKEVSFPYARPAVRELVYELAHRYGAACGEQLVVTSLTRPRNRQPRNASNRSVHPTGMALDLRRSWSRRCRSWLEGTLLTLEGAGVLDATLERQPLHYHVAVYPRQYREHGAEVLRTGRPDLYLVNRGDTLWKIAKRNDTSIDAVKAVNGLRSSRIYEGQVLKLPAGTSR